MNDFVLSQHAEEDKPRKINDLPGQEFLPGQQPEPEPVQGELFKRTVANESNIIKTTLGKPDCGRKKTLETRTWQTRYRGPLLIVSSKKPNIPPAGYAVAVVKVVGCRPMVEADEPAACCEVYPGAWAWELEDIQPINEPFPVNGQLGFYEVDYTHSEPDLELPSIGGHPLVYDRDSYIHLFRK